MKILSYAILILLMFTSPAFAGVNVSSPSNGEHVSSPFTLSASASNCSGQPVKTIGYSFDYNGDTTLVHETQIDIQISASVGTHTLHVKTWGAEGASCLTDVDIDVTSATDNVSSDSSVVPSSAISVSSLQTMGNWRAMHDGGTSGWSTGYMALLASPSHSGPSRRFVTNYSNGGGERYSISFGDDRTSTNFLWDGWVYLTNNSNHVANLEMDLDQTMPDGNTVVFGFQCDGYAGTWDYSENRGTATSPRGYWVRSQAACNPRSWKPYMWHHVQITYSRTDTGWITYKSVYLDGHESVLNAKVYGARALGWASSLTINFQVDGLGSGTNTVFLDDLTLKRW